ncbi:hypothetical protein [Algoriphagus sp.]|uniref:hypothetical protein n=1 Tax=Algoriphagus sp. TaxID=1872435 RepID=UPI0026097102|nr:hypothetical protein [Algoriphagus sp.]
MKSFLKQIALFLSFFICASIILFLSINLLINKKGNFDESTQSSTYILGHSHAEFAYNDTLINKTKNFANSAEPYFYTYSKLIKLSSHNPEIKLVTLEFSNNSISKAMNDWIWEEKYLNHRFTFYAPFLDFDQIQTLLIYNPIYTIENYFKSIINNLWKLVRDDIDYIRYFGRYSALTREMSSDEIIEFEQEQSSPISSINLYYLDKIVNFCKEKNIKLIFIRTPQHESCSELANEPTFQKIYHENYTQVPFLDLQKFPLELNDFADVEHLNQNGARKLSNWFNQKLKTGKIESLQPGLTEYFP